MSTTETLPLTRTKSFDHQHQVIERSKNARYFAYFMEQGTGKTHVTIAVMVHLFRQGLINGVIVLAPNGVQDNWERNEIPIHCPLVENQDYFTASWHSSGGMKNFNRFAWVATSTPEDKLAILLANIEAVRVKSFRESIQHFQETRKFLLVIDESTTVKNPKAEQTKHCFQIAKNAAYSRILTGTPITQSPLDLWSQCRMLDEWALPYPSFTAFKHEFAIEEEVNLGPKRPRFMKILGYKNQPTLARHIEPFSVRIMKKDCLDLPEKIYQTVYVELTAEQKRIYRDLTRKAMADLQPGLVAVTSILALLLRLQQVVMGYVPNEANEIVAVPTNRLDALDQVIEPLQGKTIIFCRFLEDVARVCERLGGINCVRYTGLESNHERSESVRSFQEDGEEVCRFFVATKAAAKGLTLHRAQNVVYYSQDFSLEARLQSEDRAHRIGQRNNVLYIDLVSPGTVDEKINAALKQKNDLANAVLDRAQVEQLITLIE